MRNRWRLEVLSPVHVGSGYRISPIEYVLDEKFYRIDMDSLFEDTDFEEGLPEEVSPGSGRGAV